MISLANGATFEPVKRAVTLIALIQIGVVIGGTSFVRGLMKCYGFGDILPASHFTDRSIWVRNWGFILLLVPVLWTGLTLYAEQRARRPATTTLCLVVGIGLVLFGLFFYLTTGSASSFDASFKILNFHVAD